MAVGYAAGRATAPQSQPQYQEPPPQQQYQAPPPPPQPEYAAPPPAPAEPAEPTMEDKVAQLKSLADLHDQGILTDEEFAAQKQKVLDS
jgi:hypothetical protein